jgi:hypothetical protein
VVYVDVLQAPSNGFNFANAIVEAAGLFGFGGEPPTFLYMTEE